MAEQPDISGKFRGRLSNAGKCGDHSGIRLAGVGLARNGYDRGKPHLAGNLPFQLLHFVSITVKQLHKAGLSAGCTLAAQQFQAVNAELHFFQVHQQFIHPQGSPLPHRHHLCGLK